MKSECENIIDELDELRWACVMANDIDALDDLATEFFGQCNVDDDGRVWLHDPYLAGSRQYFDDDDHRDFLNWVRTN